MSLKQLPIPPHFDSGKAGEVWRVPYDRRAVEAAAWAAKHAIQPAALDDLRICLVLVDCQNTFCVPGFELFVAGRSGLAAVEDSVRICEFIYHNLGSITEIAPTLDTHTTMQIFHPFFWVDDAGEHPNGAETIITLEDVERGRWKVNPYIADSLACGDYEYLQQHARHYVAQLTQAGKYPLMIWPYHAMLGSIGHALASSIEEAVFFHTVGRRRQARFEVKGSNPLTEHYSALNPEVMADASGQPIAEENRSLIDRLFGFDAVIIAGQAKSHCVAWTIRDLLEELAPPDARLAGKVYLMEDCSSPVVVPGVVDFTDQANEAYTSFAEAGMNIVRSTDPMSDWPGMSD
ncbi:MAG: hypothetical protein Q8W48_04675 [Candidatus Palauibacterales bacterium]|nr:hypothetical protein [Candidatus Palauibacterales bacterium]